MFAAARKYALIVYALISGKYIYALISGNNIIFGIQIMASLSDEDAVYVPAGKCCLRSPYLQEGDPLLFARSFNLHTKTEKMTIWLRAFRCRSSSSVCWTIGHLSSLESF